MRNLLFGIALATLAGISGANAQGYPTRSVTAIVPASAGVAVRMLTGMPAVSSLASGP